jgi:hypothetical protein
MMAIGSHTARTKGAVATTRTEDNETIILTPDCGIELPSAGVPKMHRTSDVLIEGETTKAIFIPNVDDDLQKVNTILFANLTSGVLRTPPRLS